MKCQKFTGVRNLVLQGVYKGQRIRKKLCIPLNAKVVLSVGEVNKNHKVGIAALAKTGHDVMPFAWDRDSDHPILHTEELYGEYKIKVYQIGIRSVYSAV